MHKLSHLHIPKTKLKPTDISFTKYSNLSVFSQKVKMNSWTVLSYSL